MIQSYPSVQDQSAQVETVIKPIQEPPSEPLGFLAKPLKAIEVAIEALSGDHLRAAAKSQSALFAAISNLSDLAEKTLNVSQPLEEGASLSDKEKNRLIRVETGRLIRSSDVDPEIQKRFLISQAEALLGRAPSRVQLVMGRRVQDKARQAIKKAFKASEEVKLAKGKEGNTEGQEEARRDYLEATKTVYETLEDQAETLERMVEFMKKYTETRVTQAKAIDSLVAAQTKERGASILSRSASLSNLTQK